MLSFAQKIDDMIMPLRQLADTLFVPVFDLVLRLYLASIFWKAGWLKVERVLNEDFASTVEAFTDYYPIPGVDPILAATGATIMEPLLAVLIALGLFGRFAGGGLLVMALVIEYAWAIQQDPYTFPFNHEHVVWMIISAGVLLRGAGKISLDHLLLKILRK